MRIHAPLFLLAFIAAGVAPNAFADMPAPQGVLMLSSSASSEAPRDLLSVTLSTTREGPDASAVQAQLKQALDTALAEARKAAKPGQLDVQTGNFALYPRYANKGGASGGIAGWQGSAELIVEGRDTQAIGQLTGRISTLTVARVGWSLSREVREKAEADASAQAISRFRAKAADYARQFGYAGYAIREISVNTNEAPPVRPLPMQARAMSAATDESLPIEAGKGSVIVNVSGTIQMK